LFFDSRVDSTGRSDVTFKFIVNGALPACSVGFMPLKTNRPNTKEERAKIGLGEYGTEFVKWEMLEYSPCSVPMNPNALQNMLKSNTLTKKEWEIVKDVEGIIPKDFVEEFMKEVEETFKEIEPIDIVETPNLQIDKLVDAIKLLTVEVVGLKTVLEPLLDLKSIKPPSAGSASIDEKAQDGLYSILEGEIKL
jgi:hypothetical protein